MGKRTFILLCMITSFISTVNSQAKLEFSAEVKADTTENIRAIASLWKNFFDARITATQSKEKSAYLPGYWNDEEIENGTADMHCSMRNAYGKYEKARHYTYNIRQVGDDFYEINTMLEFMPGESDRTIPLIYKICAKKVDGEFKLFNYLAFSKEKLLSREGRYINFYFPHPCKPKRRELRESEKFIAKFIDLYDLHDVAESPKITYIFERIL